MYIFSKHIFLFLSFIISITVFSQNSFAKKRALIIGIDGAAGVVFDKYLNNHPNSSLRLLADKGIYTDCQSLTDQRCALAHNSPRLSKEYKWKTAPGWASVLNGVDSNKHQVRDNNVMRGTLSEIAKSYPSFLLTAKKNGLTTAASGVSSFMSKTKKAPSPLSSRPPDTWGIIDTECQNIDLSANSSCNLTHRKTIDRYSNRDNELVLWSKNVILNSTTDIIMPVFDQVDTTGHYHGFDSNKRYLKAIKEVDGKVKLLLTAIKEDIKSNNNQWLVIVTSDHGGHSGWIGDHSDSAEDQIIPFILTTINSIETLKPLNYPVYHMDVNPTVLKWFDLPIAKNTDGRIQGISN